LLQAPHTQAFTPVLSIYLGDGTPVTGLDLVNDGDVLLYRCAHHPVGMSAKCSPRYPMT